MQSAIDDDGCPAFEAVVNFDDSAIGEVLRWGVKLDGPLGAGLWGIASEVDDIASKVRERSFTLQAGVHSEVYYLMHCSRLGALPQPGSSGIRFLLWAPNARSIDVVFADPAHGYIADNGAGVVESTAMTPMQGGVWQATFADFSQFVGRPYMFRVVKDDGSVAFRTDIYSRKQIGAGNIDPKGEPYLGLPADLDGPPSCSVVCDPHKILLNSGQEMPVDEFWADEFSADHPLPTKLEDLVIYELHVGSLGFGKPNPGTLTDAVAYVDHLVKLGVNAVELMPIAEFEDKANWGYGTSHYFAIDEAAGGTDCMRQFVRACHRQGIVVILDVCYNHFDPDGDRIEWAYDSNDPTEHFLLVRRQTQ
jgi:1,4-alpha-glucan branching enzyme